MWMRPVIRDLLDTIAAAAPDAAEALARTRGETLELLVAMLRPDRPGEEGALRVEVAGLLDGLLAERAPGARVIPLPTRAAA